MTETDETPRTIAALIEWAEEREREVREDSDWAFSGAYANAFRDEFIPKLREAEADPPEPPRTEAEDVLREFHRAMPGMPIADYAVLPMVLLNRIERVLRHAAAAPPEPLRLDPQEQALTAALPWVIVPLSDPEDPLGMLKWTEKDGKQPDWAMVARRLRERMEADARLSEAGSPGDDR